MSFALHYETTLACEPPPRGVPGACGSISEHIVLLVLTLVGNPRHRRCDRQHREQSSQQPGSALLVACVPAAAELFSVGCFPKHQTVFPSNCGKSESRNQTRCCFPACARSQKGPCQKAWKALNFLDQELPRSEQRAAGA